jgi:hypothetical protein
MTAGAQICCIPAEPPQSTPGFDGGPFRRDRPAVPVQAGGWLRDTTQSRRQEPITQAAM